MLVLHPAVADVAVFGVPNDDLGEEVKAVVQLLDPERAGPEMEAELLAFCRERLAAFKCPRIDRLRRQPPPPGHRQALQAAPQGPLLGRPHVPHRLGQRPMDRKTRRASPTSPPPAGSWRGRPPPSGATSRSRSSATSGSPTPTPTPGRPTLAKGLLASGAGKGTRVGPAGRQQPRLDRRLARHHPHGRRGRAAQHLQQGQGARAGCCATATPRCCSPSTGTSATTTSSASSRPCPASPARSTSGSSSSRTPTSGRSGRGARAAGRGPARSPTSPRAAASVSDGLLRECESEVTPADPMVVVYSSGSTADPKGAIHSHGAAVRHAHNLWQMRDLDRRGRALHADAALLGRRLQLHADRGHARRRHPRVRGAVRARRHPRPDRARAGHPGARLAAHGQGPRRPPDLQGPRPVVDPRRFLRRPPAAAHPGRRRGARAPTRSG